MSNGNDFLQMSLSKKKLGNNKLQADFGIRSQDGFEGTKSRLGHLIVRNDSASDNLAFSG